MSHLDEWLHLIASQLRSEAERVVVQAKSDLYEDSARETFVRVALKPFLPDSYRIGSGKIIDAAGNISDVQDIVIYRSDYPQFNMPGKHTVFIYESVLATIQVRSKLILKTFFSAMDQCASLAKLNPTIEATTRRAMAAKMKLRIDNKQQYIHPDPLQTGRFELIARVPSFIYGFTGYQTSEKQLAENLGKWIDDYHQQHDALQMKSLPSVIATQGCFGWRNNAPFTIKSHALMGVGQDSAPLRLIMLQILHALNRRLQNTSDGYGIKSTIAPYLAHFTPPKVSEMVGRAVNPGDAKPAPEHRPGAKPAAATRVVSGSGEALPSATGRQPEQKATPTLAEQSTSAQRTIDDGTAMRPEDSSPLPKSVNPLSLFNNEKEEVEEYQFDPIEPDRPQPEVTKAEADADSDNDPFMDTLVETPEAMQNIKSEPTTKKPEYVSESLI